MYIICVLKRYILYLIQIFEYDFIENYNFIAICQSFDLLSAI